MRLIFALLFAILVGTSAANAQAPRLFEYNGNALSDFPQTGLIRDRVVSAANTAVTRTYDIGNTNFMFGVVAVCSAGTATITVAVSSDNVNFITIDTIAAASPAIKFYNNTTVGATVAVSPLAYRWVQVTVGTCGASNTSTTTIAAK